MNFENGVSFKSQLFSSSQKKNTSNWNHGLILILLLLFINKIKNLSQFSEKEEINKCALNQVVWCTNHFSHWNTTNYLLVRWMGVWFVVSWSPGIDLLLPGTLFHTTSSIHIHFYEFLEFSHVPFSIDNSCTMGNKPKGCFCLIQTEISSFF